MDTTEFFDYFFKNARENSVIILNTDGIILKVNAAFKQAFGYEDKDVEGKNFRMLYLERDKETKQPERELDTVLLEGCASDDNYLVHNDGATTWVSGEAVLVKTRKEGTFIVKVIQNIHAQKQLERFLLEANEFVESIFESIKDTALMILDTRLKIVKVNTAFLRMFEIESSPAEGSRLADINHPFWKDSDFKQEAINFVVTNQSVKEQQFITRSKGGEKKVLNCNLKLIEGDPEVEKKILVIIKDVTTQAKNLKE